jgi:uncharacterized repeat protein (TIGR03803 family)
MKGRLSQIFRAVGMLAAALVLTGAASAAVTEQVIFNFTGGNGNLPTSPLLRDASGRLYGTASSGGIKVSPCSAHGCGVVFELSPKTGGGWNYRRLYAFQGGNDGYSPSGSLVFDSTGNLYGVTGRGGANDLGAVFKLSPAAGGKWTETIVHSFGGAPDGSLPNSGLTKDAAGNLYGTTSAGGTSASGVVYQLTNSGGSWTEAVIYTFAGMPDGSLPMAEVILDSKGNLYGTTELGGASNLGTVFELALAAGVWTETILHSFNGSSNDLGQPVAALCFDSTGNLFGTATNNLGALFELVHNSDGSYTESQLHSFGVLLDGAGPLSGLVRGKPGSFYGTTYNGGKSASGTLYQLSLVAGKWRESVIYNFTGYSGSDGEGPVTSVTIVNGVFCGTTAVGGSAGDGTVYQITP